MIWAIRPFVTYRALPSDSSPVRIRFAAMNMAISSSTPAMSSITSWIEPAPISPTHQIVS